MSIAWERPWMRRLNTCTVGLLLQIPCANLAWTSHGPRNNLRSFSLSAFNRRRLVTSSTNIAWSIWLTLQSLSVRIIHLTSFRLSTSVLIKKATSYPLAILVILLVTACQGLRCIWGEVSKKLKRIFLRLWAKRSLTPLTIKVSHSSLLISTHSRLLLQSHCRKENRCPITTVGAPIAFSSSTMDSAYLITLWMLW